MCYNEVSVENEIIFSNFAEKGPYNMTMWYVVPQIVTDTWSLIQFIQFRREMNTTHNEYHELIN